MKSVRRNWKLNRLREEVGSRYNFLLLLTAVIFVVGCVSGARFMTLSDAAYLHKGMSVAGSKSVLPRPPRYEFSFDFVLIDAYTVVSGDYSSHYILAFLKDSLVYWGYPHEFARSKDAFINFVGEQAVARLEQLEYEEAQERQKQAEQQPPNGPRR
jgi:hypothetical protein